MTAKVVLAGCALLLIGRVAIQAQVVRPASGCRAVGLFVLDVAVPDKPKMTVSPWKLEVSYPKPDETDREVCFAILIVNGDKNDRPQQLRLKGFDTVKGRNGRPVFKAKKLHAANADVVSLEFDDVPDWDSDGDGVLQDVVQPFDIEAKFKGFDVLVDPDVVIKKPGG